MLISNEELTWTTSRLLSTRYTVNLTHHITWQALGRQAACGRLRGSDMLEAERKQKEKAGKAKGLMTVITKTTVYKHARIRDAFSGSSETRHMTTYSKKEPTKLLFARSITNNTNRIFFSGFDLFFFLDFPNHAFWFTPARSNTRATLAAAAAIAPVHPGVPPARRRQYKVQIKSTANAPQLLSSSHNFQQQSYTQKGQIQCYTTAGGRTWQI